MSDSITSLSLDELFQTTSIGSLDKAIGANLYGINHRQITSAVPLNQELYGLTFFTRPQLNLTSENIRHNRRMYPLLSADATSLQRYVRCMLDPRQQTGYKLKTFNLRPLDCPFVDPHMGFIPVLTNDLKSVSGWPDLVLPTRESTPGLYQEVHGMADGIGRNYGAFDLDLSFKNSRGSPAVFLFYVWYHYMAAVYEGTMMPYLDMIAENEIDYNTRVYRLVLDKQRRTVTKIAACGAALPLSLPMGAFFDYNSERPFNDQTNDISVRLRCFGAEYLDDILIDEFNQVSEMFCTSMRPENIQRDMVEIPDSIIGSFNNRCYPRIDNETYVLKWYATKSLYQARTGSFLTDNADPFSTENQDNEGD